MAVAFIHILELLAQPVKVKVVSLSEDTKKDALSVREQAIR